MTTAKDSSPEHPDDTTKTRTPPERPTEYLNGTAVTTDTPWKWHHEDFGEVLGAEPSIQLLMESSYPFAHEAGVYIASEDSLFITSNRLMTRKGQRVQISKLYLGITKPRCRVVSKFQEIDNGAIHMGNGGVNYRDGVLFCAQGSQTSPSGLYWLPQEGPYEAQPMLTGYHDVPFNSVNDVVVSKIDGSIWFTDPPYGAEQGYKETASLPSQVYRYSPAGGDSKEHDIIRAVVDGFGHPNGLCFSPDESILYVTDTDKQHGSGEVFHDRPSSIYAFDIVRRNGMPFVCNRRLFAYVEVGIPDGIKCDTQGRVYSGCGDGIRIWSPEGILLGRIHIDGGVANFCFGRKGEIFALNEDRIWVINIASTTEGALLAELQSPRPIRGKPGIREQDWGFRGLWRRLRKLLGG